MAAFCLKSNSPCKFTWLHVSTEPSLINEIISGLRGVFIYHVGDERSEHLEFIPAKVQVIVNVRKKYACKACEETIKIASMPAQMIPKSIATPGSLSHIAISKYDDHLPLYRQEEILLRHGIDIARNTLGEWMIRSGEAVEPLIHHRSA